MGYEHTSGEFRAQEFEWLNMAPAGVVTASVGDMARFMIAHLQYGTYEDALILGEETSRSMQERHAGNANELNGTGYGFYELHTGEQRVIGHAGDTALFHSMLMLVPAEGLGVFVSFNSVDGRDATRAIRDSFISEVLAPGEPLEQVPMSDRHQNLAGVYRLTNSAYSTVEKFVGLFGAYRINVDGEAIVVEAPASDEMLPAQTTRFEPVHSANDEELLFQEADGSRVLAFWNDARTGKTYAFFDHAPVFSLERMARYEDPQIHQLALAMLLLVLLSGLIAAPVSYFRSRDGAEQPLPARIAGWTMLALGSAALVLVGGLAAVVIRMDDLVAGDTTLLAFVLVLPLLIMAGSIVATVVSVVAWKDRYWGISSRAHLTVIAISGLALGWFFDYWNLLGWQY